MSPARRATGDGPYFTPATLRFLRELRANNDRAWFAAEKERYEDVVRDPALRVIADFAPELARISPHFHATPRSLYRIHRDTRFAKDKSPYKTHIGLHFRHDRARDAHAPGFYLHVEPGSVFAGVGIWHPEPDALRRIREHIVDEPAAWKRASRDKRFLARFTLEGDRLSRAPKGFDPEHPLADDLKWKDYIGVVSLPDAFATRPDLPKKLAETFRAGTPLMRFLCGGLGVPF